MRSSGLGFACSIGAALLLASFVPARADAVCDALNRLDAAAAGNFRAIVPATKSLPQNDLVVVPPQLPQTSGNNVAIRPGAVRFHAGAELPGGGADPKDNPLYKRLYDQWLAAGARCFPGAPRRTVTNRTKFSISHHELVTMVSGNQLHIEYYESLGQGREYGSFVSVDVYKGAVPQDMLAD